MITPLLSPQQVADATGLHYETVLELCRRGDLPALKISTHWKIRQEDYEAWLESKRFEPRKSDVSQMVPTRLRTVQHRADSPGSISRLTAIEKRQP